MVTKFIKSKLLVILGPTSTGKTDLALQLASKFQGELVSVDSRQVYKGLDIGTGKLPGKLRIDNGQLTIKKGKKFWEMNGVKVWMYDVVDPKKQYTVFDYVKDTRRIINDILRRGKLPIIVGGTGFYLKALLEGLSNLTIPMDPKLREELDSLSLQELQTRLQELSTQKWEKMNSSDRQNPRRLIRAIELSVGGFQRTGKITTLPRQMRLAQSDVLKIGLTAPREILYQRIDERVIDRINQGMIDEAEELHKKGLTFKRMRQLGLEYGILADYMENKIKNKEELIKLLQGKIHGYARRQITWFKKEKEVFWFDITEKGFAEKIEKLVIKWYDK